MCQCMCLLLLLIGLQLCLICALGMLGPWNFCMCLTWRWLLLARARQRYPHSGPAIFTGCLHYPLGQNCAHACMHAMCVTSRTTVQCTQHGGDDYDKIIKGDPGLESIYEWTKSGPAVPFRGATGKGDGVHVLSGIMSQCLLPSVA